MRSPIAPLRNAYERFQQEGFAGLARGLRNQVVRCSESVGMRRDLSLSHATPQAKIPITVRRGGPEDMESLARAAGSPSRAEQRELRLRAEHAAANCGRLYVAVEGATERVCFIQWVMDHRDNGAIRNLFRGRFPVLRPEEVLFENAYTPSNFRGLGVMSAAMSTIAEHEGVLGFQSGITFVACHNTASIKGCTKAGFFPYVLRRDVAMCGGLMRRRHFLPLPHNSAEQIAS